MAIKLAAAAKTSVGGGNWVVEKLPLLDNSSHSSTTASGTTRPRPMAWALAIRFSNSCLAVVCWSDLNSDKLADYLASDTVINKLLQSQLCSFLTFDFILVDQYRQDCPENIQLHLAWDQRDVNVGAL